MSPFESSLSNDSTSFYAQIDKMTVATLKAFLKSRGMPVGGKKGDLVSRIKQALQDG